MTSPDPERILVEFPLRGEWVAYHTPAEKVPSHGVDQLGQRYAYDLMRIERGPKGWRFFRGSSRRYYAFGVPLRDCLGWGAPIHAPFAGSVVASRDGLRERDPVHLLRDLAVVLKNALVVDPRKPGALHALVGNHLILRMSAEEMPGEAVSGQAVSGEGVYALIAHARTGSILVREGDEIVAGQLLAEVGHSGNSTAPHLHFQLMDGPDLVTARGLPCAFREYEALRGEAWVAVAEGIPAKREFVRRGP